MRLPAATRLAIAIGAGCGGRAPAETTAPPPATPFAAAPPAATAPAAPPPAVTCPPPTADEAAAIARAVGSAARPICAERAGWLVEVPASPASARVQLWTVPAIGDATPLDEAWLAGPVADFDGDGRVEASTIADDAEAMVWFDGGAQPAYIVRPDAASWLVAHAGTLAPARVYADAAQTPGAPPDTRRGPPYTCTSDDGEAAAIEHALSRGLAPAPCAQATPAERAAGEAAIATAVIAARGVRGVIGASFSWGCTSHGDTPVVIDYDGFSDRTGAELWLVRDAGRAPRRLDAVTSSAPDEWSSHDGIALGPSGDFDGDGAAESIVVHSHHASAHGTSFAYETWIAGDRFALPSDLVVRTPGDGRDAVVRTGGFASPHVTTPCGDGSDVDPDTRLDCELQPPDGYVRPTSCGPWDWDKHPPKLAGIAGALPARAVAALVSATAPERAALPPP